MLCPCHSEKTYEDCCKQCHEKTLLPEPTALMRSRYSAYALDLVDYIIETTDPLGPLYQQDQTTWKQEIKIFCEQTMFFTLEIKDSILLKNKAYVTFSAGITQQGLDSSYTERSCFKKRNGIWLYHSGKILS